MAWVKVAEGTSLSDLKPLVADLELPKGSKMRVDMNLIVPVGGLFNTAAAEWVTRPFVPDGMELFDVRGSGNTGIVEMEADPAWLLAVLAFIKAHWLALTIAGFALWLIISLISISVNIPAAAQIPVWLVVGAALGIVGLVVMGARSPPRRAT